MINGYNAVSDLIFFDIIPFITLPWILRDALTIALLLIDNTSNLKMTNRAAATNYKHKVGEEEVPSINFNN